MKRLIFALVLLLMLTTGAQANYISDGTAGSAGSGLWEDVNGNVVPVGSAPVVVDGGFTSIGNTELRTNIDTDIGQRFYLDPAQNRLYGDYNGINYGYIGGSTISWYTLRAANQFHLSTHNMACFEDPWLRINGSTASSYLGLGLYADDLDTEPTLAVVGPGRVLINTTVDDEVNTLQVNGSGAFTGAVSSKDYIVYANATSSQSLGAFVYTLINFEESFDSDNVFSNSEYTAPKTGLYLITGAVTMAPTTWAVNDYLALRLAINGGTIAPLISQVFTQAAGTYSLRGNFSTVLRMTSGQKLRIGASPSKASNTNGGAQNTWLRVNYLTSD